MVDFKVPLFDRIHWSKLNSNNLLCVKPKIYRKKNFSRLVEMNWKRTQRTIFLILIQVQFFFVLFFEHFKKRLRFDWVITNRDVTINSDRGGVYFVEPKRYCDCILIGILSGRTCWTLDNYLSLGNISLFATANVWVSHMEWNSLTSINLDNGLAV